MRERLSASHERHERAALTAGLPNIPLTKPLKRVQNNSLEYSRPTATNARNARIRVFRRLRLIIGILFIPAFVFLGAHTGTKDPLRQRAIYALLGVMATWVIVFVFENVFILVWMVGRRSASEH